MSALARKITRRVVVDSNGCWNWPGAKSDDGYGRVRVPGGGLAYTHRALFEELRGPIAEGLTMDHLCRNRACCNPDHLEAVTQAENNRRGTQIEAMARLREQRTHCRNGHEFTVDNSYYGPRGYRQCRECRRLKNLDWHVLRMGRNKPEHRINTAEGGAVIAIGGRKTQ